MHWSRCAGDLMATKVVKPFQSFWTLRYKSVVPGNTQGHGWKATATGFGTNSQLGQWTTVTR